MNYALSLTTPKEGKKNKNKQNYRFLLETFFMHNSSY